MYLETLNEYDYKNDVLIWTVVEMVEDGKDLSFRPMSIINRKKVNNCFVVTYTRKDCLRPIEPINSIKKYIDFQSISTYVDRVESYEMQYKSENLLKDVRSYTSDNFIAITQF